MTTTTTPRGATTTTLVDAHLSAWNETDPERRRALIARCWAEDGALVDPPLDGHGHGGIDELMGALQEHYPAHRFVRTTGVDVHHDTFRVGWELQDSSGEVALAGTDVGMIDAAGRLTRISGFFGALPALEEEAGSR